MLISLVEACTSGIRLWPVRHVNDGACSQKSDDEGIILGSDGRKACWDYDFVQPAQARVSSWHNQSGIAFR